MNIILICSDTFRYDHLGRHRQDVLTPNLDRMAEESADFADFWVCSFPTIVHRIEVFTGRYTFPLIDWGSLPRHFPVLAEVFRHHGFTSALIADNPHLLKKQFGFRRGFDFAKAVGGQMWDHFLPDSAPMADLPCPLEKLEPRVRRVERYRRNAHWYREHKTTTTQEVFRETIRWLEQPPERFFLWVDCFDPHEPWDAPQRFLEPYPWNHEGDAVLWPSSGEASRYSEADLANMRSLYRAEVTQVDFWMGKLLKAMEQRGQLQDTVILFCSDHGYYFGEHGFVGKPLKDGIENPIYEEMGHLPLLIRHPAGLAAGQTIRGLCQPVDLFATLLDLAGLPPASWAQGSSLVPRLHGQPGTERFVVSGAYPRQETLGALTVWTDEWCLVYSPSKGLAGSGLYHRPSDPTQLRNVIAAHHKVAEEHFRLLCSWLDELAVPAQRQEQLLYARGFNWKDRVRRRLWTLRNWWTYQTHYRHFGRAAACRPKEDRHVQNPRGRKHSSATPLAKSY